MAFSCFFVLFTSQATYGEGIQDSDSLQIPNLVQNNFNYNLENLNKNSNPGLKSPENSQTKLETSQLESMSASQLLRKLKEELQTVRLDVITLTSLSQSSRQELLITSQKLEDCLKHSEELTQALISNKEDMGPILEELGRLQAEIDQLKELVAFYKKASNQVNSLIPASAVSGGLMVAGGFLLYEGIVNKSDFQTKLGATFLGVGGAGFATIELVWNLKSRPKLRLKL